VTEVPEHLLARSRARREAAGLAPPSDAATPATTGGEVAPAAATPAPATTPAPAPAPPPPPKPDPPYIKAYKERKKIPFWAMPALIALPFWAFIYANTLETPKEKLAGPIAEGKAIFTSAGCASCHGSSGEGGVGPSFQNGSVTKTWPNYLDHILWVQTGSAAWPTPTYGATNKPTATGVMPSFKDALTPDEVVLVVRYEREVLAGSPPDPGLVALSEKAAAGTDVSASLEKTPSADPTKPAPPTG
jgi:mono/diheme cytochrome c family protein